MLRGTGNLLKERRIGKAPMEVYEDLKKGIVLETREMLFDATSNRPHH
jgi:hypothetical protein